MADVVILPPAQVQTVAAAGGQTGQTAPQSPPQGALVSGTIVGRDTNGNYLLKSPQGTFTLHSSTPLTYNSDVTIRIGANAAGNTNARIVTVNGEPFAAFATPDPETSDSVSTSVPVTAPQAPDAPVPANIDAVPATVIAVPASAPDQPASATLTTGSTVIIRLPQAVVPAPTQSETQTQPEAQSASPQPDAQPVATPAAISNSTATAVQPQPITQSAQPVAPQPAQATSPAPTNATPTAASVTNATAAPVETVLAPSQAVTQTEQTQTTQPQAPQSPAPAAAPQPEAATAPPPASVAASYSVYTKQSATTTFTPSAPAAPAPSAAPAASAPAAPASSSPVLTQSAPASPAPTSIPAQVVTADQNGILNLQTPLGTITVKTTATPSFPITPGSSLTLEIPAPALQALSSQPATLTELASSWQSLKDILTLTGNDPATATNTLLSRLPQLGTNFVNSSISFISSLLQGDARKLLGDDIADNLQQSGRQDLIEKFSGEMATMGTAFTAPAARELPGWQTFFLPFVYQEALQQARIYVKRDAPKKDRTTSKSAEDTRFVVEVDLTELGPMQMDGLVRKKPQATAFDLIIRSHHAFSNADQNAITGIYNDASQMTGFRGTLSFQVTRDFPVKPLEEIAGEKARSITA